MTIWELQRDGFAILEAAFGQEEIDDLIEALSRIDATAGVRSRGGVYAIRNLLQLSPSIEKVAQSAKICGIVDQCLGGTSFPVRGTLFDKTGSANWLVPLHQDLTITVKSRADVQGYGPWTTKAGICHVQPPTSILENMLSVRIHLDDCDESNGALRVLPGTHRSGRLTAEQISDLQRSSAATCAARRGDVLLMRPLLLHASSTATKPGHRRVIHIDYACSQLDGGLQWLVK